MVEITIKGKVQGVGFRYFTKNTADEMHIFGWVKNQANGDVTCLAISDKKNIEKFIEKLYQAQSASKVESITEDWSNNKKLNHKDYVNFSIIT